MRNSLTEKSSQIILCHYINATNNIQVARIANIQDWYFERVVFPGQHLLFDAPQHGQLEIYGGHSAQSNLIEQIPCGTIQIESSADSIQRHSLARE